MHNSRQGKDLELMDRDLSGKYFSCETVLQVFQSPNKSIQLCVDDGKEN